MSTLNYQLTEINNWLSTHHKDPINKWSSVNGGCISQAFLIETQSKKRYFAKTRPGNIAANQDVTSVANDIYIVEAIGLAAMEAATDLTIPDVMHSCDQFILMEYLEPQAVNSDYWRKLGQGLAQMHEFSAPSFGFSINNYCGETSQPNPRIADGFEFFSQYRLWYQAKMAHQKGLLNMQDLQGFEVLCTQLKELLPEQKATLIHGDLWSGNIISDNAGNPALIDPATHWGWAEADIAMTLLFGGFRQEFYDVYNEVKPMLQGWQQRMALYNLYHLLNHLNIFGRSYLAQVRSTLADYT